jgi:GntR family transcriptional repressor for pyruvate dehydrogenase complex
MLWGIKPVQQQAAYGLAVERLRRQIQLGLLLPGERMPAERKLSEELNVSRVTLREALRILATEGYLSVRRGAHGGAFISDEADLRKLALRKISLDPAGVMRALEFREANERRAARLAATRRTPANLHKLKDALKAIHVAASASELKRAETTFELALGEASQNAHFVHAIEEALAAEFVPLAQGPLPETRRASEDLREKLVEAIESRDEASADELVGEMIARDRIHVRSLARVA